MCSHIRQAVKKCAHSVLEFCPHCQEVVCKQCGKEWGKKETEYIYVSPAPTYPYYPYIPYYPSYPNWIIPYPNNTTAGVFIRQ